MNGDGQPAGESDNSSSPAFSASSERDEEVSSPESSPPPHDNGYRDTKRDSDPSSVYSRSYQSVLSDNGFPRQRFWSNASSRPFTADTSITEDYRYEDSGPQELAAAVGLLSCSYGTPQTGPTRMPSDIPPVPPLPEKYANIYTKYPAQEDVIMDEESSDDEQQGRRPRTTHDDFEGVFGKMDA